MKVILFSLGFDTRYQVDYCITGEEALNQVINSVENGFFYSAILTDISMPVMDGIEATKKIRMFYNQQMIQK
jgi:CheY-like chemotaxis protein